MNRDAPIDRLVVDLRAVLADLEAVLEAAQRGGGAGSGALDEPISRLRSGIHELKVRLSEQVEQGAGAVDQYVRDNAWQALGIAAVFIAGLLMSRRADDSHRRSR